MRPSLTGGDKLKEWLAKTQKELSRKRHVQVGFFKGATYVDGTPVATVASSNEFGAITGRGGVIPARPFIRPTIAEKQAQWGKAGQSVLKITNYNVDQALEAIGAAAVGDIQNKIAEITEPKLAESTIKAKRAKGSEQPEKPLIDTTVMARSVSYQVSSDD